MNRSAAKTFQFGASPAKLLRYQGKRWKFYTARYAEDYSNRNTDDRNDSSSEMIAQMTIDYRAAQNPEELNCSCLKFVRSQKLSKF